MTALLLIASLGCAPTPAEIENELVTLRERHALSEGTCRIADELPPWGEPLGCSPGRWVESVAEIEDLAIRSRAHRPTTYPDPVDVFTPEEALVVGLALQNSGAAEHWDEAFFLQQDALDRGVARALLVEVQHWRPSPELLGVALVHGVGVGVLKDGGWAERREWQRLARAVDAEPGALDRSVPAARASSYGNPGRRWRLPSSERELAVSESWRQALTAVGSPNGQEMPSSPGPPAAHPAGSDSLGPQ